MKIVPNGNHLAVQLEENDHFLGEFPDENRWTALIEESAGATRTLKFQLSNGAWTSIIRHYSDIVTVYGADGRQLQTNWNEGFSEVTRELSDEECMNYEDGSPEFLRGCVTMGKYPNTQNQINLKLDSWGNPREGAIQ